MILSTLHPILEALDRALLHFLWQGIVLALLLVVFQALARPARASVRYAASCGVMALMFASFVTTVFRTFSPAPRPVIRNAFTASVPLTPAPAAPAKQGPLAPAYFPRLPVKVRAFVPPDWIAAGWMLGVLSLSLYTACGWTRVRRLKRHALRRLDSTCLEAPILRLGITRTVGLYSSCLAEVPAVIGWLRPYILLPVAALTALTESQVRALLAHELAHIRRHDYLISLVQTAVETLLFYHPAVWWVGRQIRQEREHCCDDTAVALCGHPVEYASALVEMEQIRIPELALAANGGDLLARVRRLLGEPDHGSRSLRRIAAATAALLIALVPALLSQEARPSFEVTSVKQNTSGDPGMYFRLGGTIPTITNQTLKNIILMAYRIQDFQLTGGPGWIGSDHYDVQGKTTADTSIEERRGMVQSLLETRFKLALHREIKELPVYNLTVAKGGFKLEPIKAGSCIVIDPKSTPPSPGPGKSYMDYCGSGGFGRGMMEASSSTMAELAEALSHVLHRTVVDKTGISGQFRYHLTFAPEETSTSEIGGPPPAFDSPSVFGALQEQLGLKLDSARGAVEVLVIDHVERPTEN